MGLISTPLPETKAKWQTNQQLFVGLVTGSNQLIAAMADAPKPGVADLLRRTLRWGTALTEPILHGALARAFNKGRQLPRSLEITEIVITQASPPAIVSLAISSNSQPELSNGQPNGHTAPPI